MNYVVVYCAVLHYSIILRMPKHGLNVSVDIFEAIQNFHIKFVVTACVWYSEVTRLDGPQTSAVDHCSSLGNRNHGTVIEYWHY